MRILTEIPDEDIQKLDAIAAKSKRSRAAAIREAVKLYLIDNGRAGMLAMANWYSFIWRPVFGGNPDAMRKRALLEREAQP